MKELHIWLCDYPKFISPYVRLESTEFALDQDDEIVHTTQPHVCSTTWLVKGYRIFAHMLDGEVIEIKLGECCGREIRISHNLEKMLLANVFGLATRNY
jgi:hypothetical protein